MSGSEKQKESSQGTTTVPGDSLLTPRGIRVPLPKADEILAILVLSLAALAAALSYSLGRNHGWESGFKFGKELGVAADVKDSIKNTDETLIAGLCFDARARAYSQVAMDPLKMDVPEPDPVALREAIQEQFRLIGISDCDDRIEKFQSRIGR